MGVATIMASGDVCMVCFGDERPLYTGICQCRGIAVHKHCFAKLLTVPSHNTRCAVCHAPYNHFVSVQTRPGIQIASPKLAAVSVILWGIFIFNLWGAISLCLIIYRRGTTALGVFGIALCTFAGGVAFALMLVYYGFFSCVQRIRIHKWEIDFNKLKLASVHAEAGLAEEAVAGVEIQGDV